MSWSGLFVFSGSVGVFGSADFGAGAVVSALWVDGELADDFAGGGVDDAHVVAVDEHDDAGSVEGLSDADVVELAVDAQGDAAGADAVVANAELGVGLLLAGGGFGSCGVRDGWCGAVWQRAVWPLVVVDVNESVELGLQLGEGVRGRLSAEPFLHRLLESFDFAASGWVVGTGVLLQDAVFDEFVLEGVAGRAAPVGEAGGEHQTVVGQGGEGDPVFGDGCSEGVEDGWAGDGLVGGD